MPDIPQIAFPPQIVNGQLATVEQGGIDDTIGQVHLLCLTPQGWLTSSPDFGLAPQQHRRGGADVQEIERQISTYVPDATATVDEDPTGLNQALAVVGVRVG